MVAIEKGAPVTWVPLDLVPTNVGGAAIAAQPPHPHAALLMADYLGPEGQGVLERYQYGNAAKNYGFKRWRPDHGTSTDKYEKELTGWEKLSRDISRK